MVVDARREAFSMTGVYRYLKASPDTWWARVEVRRGEWTDLSKADYDAQGIEPSFWGLLEEESWREDATRI